MPKPPKIAIKKVGTVFHATWQIPAGRKPDGSVKYRYRSKALSKDKRTATMVLARMQLAFDRSAGGLPASEDVPWAEVCRRYLRDVAANLEHPEGARYALQDFNRRVQVHAPAEITGDLLDRYVTLCLEAKRAPVGIRRYMGVIRKVCRWMCAQGIVPRNPAEGAGRVKGQRKPGARHLSTSEADLYLKKATGLYLRFGQLGLYTGFRPGEILMTAWADIDWDHGTIRVTEKPAYDWHPKTYESRTIRIHPKLMPLLKAWQAEARHPLILCRPDGSPIREKVVNRHFSRTLRKQIGIPHLKPYVFRHTFAAQYLYRNPSNIYELSKILGHASIRTTQAHYEHIAAAYVPAGIENISYDVG